MLTIIKFIMINKSHLFISLFCFIFLFQCTSSDLSSKGDLKNSVKNTIAEKELYVNELLNIEYVEQLTKEMLKEGQELFTGVIYKSGNEPFTFLGLSVNDSTIYPLIGTKAFLSAMEEKQGITITLAGRKVEVLKKQAIQVETIQNN